jgi:hypothetical protein
MITKYKLLIVPAFVFGGLVSLSACWEARQVLKPMILPAQKTACALAQESTDSKVVAKLCDIADDLMPMLTELLAGKAQMMRDSPAGMCIAQDGGKTCLVPEKKF